MRFDKILLPVDKGPVSTRAADAGLHLARALGARVAFVHVVDPGKTVLPGGGMAAEDLIEAAREDGARLLARLRTRAALEVEPHEFIVVGKPAAEIVTAAREWEADLIIMGSHDRQGVERVLLGSVAAAVGRDAPCSVLVVRDRG